MEEVIKWLGLPASVVMIIWGAFFKLDPLLRDEPKNALVSWLLGDRTSEGKWLLVPVRLFDRVFHGVLSVESKVNFFVWPRFSRSVIASLVSTLVVLILLPSIGSVWCIDDSCDEILRSLWKVLPNYGLPLLLLLTTGNIVIDYISLCKTRLILSFVSRTRKYLIALILFCLDVVLTFVLWNFLFDLLFVASIYVLGEDFSRVDYGPEVWLNSALIHGNDAFVVFFWNTFLTLTWSLLFLLAAGLVRINTMVQHSFVWTQKTFNFDQQIENQPLTTLGYVVAVVLMLMIGSMNVYTFLSQ